MLPGVQEILVDEGKIVTWLRLSVLVSNPKISFTNLDLHVKGVVDLYNEQRSAQRNPFPHPRSGCALRGFLQAIRKNQAGRLENLFLDPSIGGLLDGYTADEHVAISNYFFDRNSSVGLRSRVDFLLSHSMLGRSEDKRHARLCHFYLFELIDEGPTPCMALICTFFKSTDGRSSLPHWYLASCSLIHIFWFFFFLFCLPPPSSSCFLDVFYSVLLGKTNKEGRKELGCAIRHKDVQVCPVSSFAFYLLFRFEIENERMPNFSSRRSWYRTVLLRGKSRYVWQSSLPRESAIDSYH